MTTHTMGEEGFRWFFGVVEDRQDPKQIGRVRVRIYNVHPFTEGGAPDKVNVPTEHLPWATPINSITSAGILGIFNDGVGVAPVGMMVGTTVFGFFADGNECQQPVVLGTLTGLGGLGEQNELPKSAVGVNSAGILKFATNVPPFFPFPGEPSFSFGAVYPYNKVMHTESGHLIEVDDTPGSERINIMHKTGSYVEIDRIGQMVVKSVTNKYDVTILDNNVFVGGNINVRIIGNANMTVDGNVDLGVKGNVDLGVRGNVNMAVNGNLDTAVKGTYTVESKGNMVFKAPQIDFNP